MQWIAVSSNGMTPACRPVHILVNSSPEAASAQCGCCPRNYAVGGTVQITPHEQNSAFCDYHINEQNSFKSSCKVL